jgi:hypothetical protein
MSVVPQSSHDPGMTALPLLPRPLVNPVMIFLSCYLPAPPCLRVRQSAPAQVAVCECFGLSVAVWAILSPIAVYAVYLAAVVAKRRAPPPP